MNERERSPEEIEAEKLLDERIREQDNKNHLIGGQERAGIVFPLLGFGEVIPSYNNARLDNAVKAIRIIQDLEQAHSDSQWVNSMIENGIGPDIILRIWDSKDNKARDDKEQRKGQNNL